MIYIICAYIYDIYHIDYIYDTYITYNLQLFIEINVLLSFTEASIRLYIRKHIYIYIY